MLPGFNNNDVFMAVEGFTAGQHNRSDEAFTIADLEEFEATNNVSSNLPTTSMSSQKSTSSMEDDNTDSTTKNTKPITKQNKPMDKPGKKPMDKPGKKPMDKSGKKPMDKSGKKLMDKQGKKPMDKPNTKDRFENTNHFQDLDPEVEEEPEDPEMYETAETDMISEEPEPVVEEEDTNQDMEMTTETEKPADLEGFTGSRVVSENWLNSLLKTILLTFVAYVLFNPSTAKVMAKNFGNTGMGRDLIICAIFFLVCYIILVSF